MIKKIPIKGISRDPSGQVSADGMCAESLNVQLDMGEVAPMMAPKPVTEYGDISFEGDILYIHKGVGYENLIVNNNGQISYYPTISSGKTAGVISHTITGDIKSIIAVGNTLVVSADDMHYILWKEDAYKYLGSRIPEPIISFYPVYDEQRTVPSATSFDTTPDRPTTYDFSAADAGFGSTSVTLRPTKWGSKGNNYETRSASQQSFLDQIWGRIDSTLSVLSAQNKTLAPVLLRSAVRLYNGDYIYQSIPILLGADISKIIDIKTKFLTSLSEATDEQSGQTGIFEICFLYANIAIASGYKVMMQAYNNNNQYEDWSDIVSSIDLFSSGPILTPNRKSIAIEQTYNNVLVDGSGIQLDITLANASLGRKDTVKEQETELMNYQSTYLFASYSISQYQALAGEFELDIPFSSDYLYNQEALKETPGSMHHIFGANIFKYNNRLLLTDAKLGLSHGYPFLPSAIWYRNEQGLLTPSSYVFHYFLHGENGENIVISRNHTNTGSGIRGREANIVPGDSNTFIEALGPWIAYPDSRCYKVVITHNGMHSVTIPMKPANQIDIAYAFLGYGIVPNFPSSIPQITENDVYSYQNAIVPSKINNPFIFPTQDIISFSAGEVMAIAAITTPLSEGQAGQFQIYAFTDEGVFAISVTSEGDFSTIDNISRDVLLNKDAVAGIEQGVFFAAARGLLLLQGHNITKVSELMDGKPDSLSNELAQSIASRFFSGIPIEETAPFYQFLNGCKIAYDYANSRIILYREGQSDMYVYKFNTQSWHRMAWNPLRTPVRTLNSYPEAFIVESDGLGHQVPMNYSTLAEDPEGLPIPGLVYTRDLSLDEIDIYKTINRLKVRGRYTDGHVKWALQGSNDGINYRTLHSLRGPSWKWYRIAVVTLLDAQERISYIELDYTPKFTNKIR